MGRASVKGAAAKSMKRQGVNEAKILRSHTLDQGLVFRQQ